MKRVFILILLFPTLLHAQLTMREVLLQMPDSLVPYLSRENRLDMLDYLDAKMQPEVTNELQGKSKLLSLGSDSLVLYMNESHELTLYLLDAETEVDSSLQVIVMRHTYQLTTGETDVVVRYFSHRWTGLEFPPQLSISQRERIRSSVNTLLRRDDDIFKRGTITSTF